MSGRYHEALPLLEALTTERPDDTDVTGNLGLAYAQLGQPERAIEVLKLGLTKDPDHYYLHLYMICYNS